jgi:hypothetical protein
MPALGISGDEFSALAASVSALAQEFLAGLDDRPTVSSTSAGDTTAFDLALPEEGVGEAVVRDLEAITEHVRAPTGASPPVRFRIRRPNRGVGGLLRVGAQPKPDRVALGPEWVCDRADRARMAGRGDRL